MIRSPVTINRCFPPLCDQFKEALKMLAVTVPALQVPFTVATPHVPGTASVTSAGGAQYRNARYVRASFFFVSRIVVSCSFFFSPVSLCSRFGCLFTSMYLYLYLSFFLLLPIFLAFFGLRMRASFFHSLFPLSACLSFLLEMFFYSFPFPRMVFLLCPGSRMGRLGYAGASNGAQREGRNEEDQES